jgi:hypothetical protein
MNKRQVTRIRRQFQAAIAKMAAARLTTTLLQEVLARGEGKLLVPITQCTAAHDAALKSIGSLSDILTSSALSTLQSAAAELRNKAESAQKQAKELNTADGGGVKPLAQRVADLLKADEDCLSFLRDVAAAYDVIHAFDSGLSDQLGTWTVVFERGEKYASGLVIAVICLAVLRWFGKALGSDPLLEKLALTESARGLLTLLVGVGTVFIGTMIVIGMWLGDGDEESERKFLRSKEIFALLLSVFGTVLGFYYGNEKSAAREPALSMTPVAVSRAANSPTIASISAVLSGGKPPYAYSIESDKAESLRLTNATADAGVILHTFTSAPPFAVQFTLVVTDAATNHLRRDAELPAAK